MEDETVLITSCSYGNFIPFETRMVNFFISTFGGMMLPGNMVSVTTCLFGRPPEIEAS